MKKRILALLLSGMMLIGSMTDTYASELGSTENGWENSQESVGMQPDREEGSESGTETETSMGPEETPAAPAEAITGTEIPSETEETGTEETGTEVPAGMEETEISAGTEETETKLPADTEESEEAAASGKDIPEENTETEEDTDQTEELLDIEDLSCPVGLLKTEEIILELDESSADTYYLTTEDALQQSAKYDHEWDKYSNNYFYNQLSQDEKWYWEALDSTCLDYLSTTQSATKEGKSGYRTDLVWEPELSIDRMKEIGYMFRFSNPQYYFLNNVIYRGSSQGGNLFAFGIYSAFADGTIRKAETAKVQSKLNEWGTILSSCATEEEKVKKIHDLILAKVDYNDAIYAPDFNEEKEFTQTAYSVFCTDYTVCAGYAQAFEMVCNGVGIDAVAVTSANHEWNKVRVNDSWYNVDCTWDDQSSAIYTYFGRSDNFLDTESSNTKTSHTEESYWLKYLPICSLDTHPMGMFSPGTFPAVAGRTAEPVVSLGANGKTDKITLSCVTPGAEIYYTLDGTLPSPSSTRSWKYKGPFTLEEGDKVTAIAVSDSYWDSAPVTGDVNVVTFDGNGADNGSMANMVYFSGGPMTLQANAYKRTGYSFAGWNTREDGKGNAYSDKQQIPGGTFKTSLTLYAQWKKVSYTITYNLNGGKNNSGNPTSYTSGTAAITLKNPTRTGYNFAGWYTDSGFKKKVTQIVQGSSGNKTLYAKWTAHKYTIKFNGNGSDSGSMAAKKSCSYGTRYQLPSNAYKKKGYTFTGWNTKSNGSGKSYANKASVSSLSTKDQASVTLYAQWKKVQYKITYKLNGGSNSKSNPSSFFITSKTITLKNPSRTGYTFKGWYSDSKYKKKITQIKKGSTGTKTLYAKWSINQYTIQFYGNKSTGGSVSAMKSCKYGSSYKLKANAFKRAGYTFTGWNTRADGKGRTYKNKQSVKNLSSKSGGTVKLYAQWKINKYTVKFYGNGSQSGKMSSLNCNYGKSYKLKSNAFKRTGYQFKGWNTRADGKGKSYANKQSIKNLSSKSGAAVKLYAQWTKVKYTITYDLNGGKNDDNNPDKYYVTTGTINLKNPKRTGYTFQGWYSDSKCKKKVTQIKKGSTGNKKLYTKWSANKYSAVFDANGGIGTVENFSCTYGKNYIIPVCGYVKENYYFKEWNTKPDGSGKAYKAAQSVKNLTAKSKGTVTLYAVWGEYSSKEIQMASSVIEKVNQERTSAGCGELQKDAHLSAIAQQRAKEIAEYFSHVRPDKTSDCFTLYQSSEYEFYYAGENIAYGYGTADSVMKAWMNSSGHKSNILSTGFQKIGVGCYYSNGTYYWVQNFSD